MEYTISAIIAVSYNLSTDPLPKIKILFFLLWTCSEELLSVPNFITVYYGAKSSLS